MQDQAGDGVRYHSQEIESALQPISKSVYVRSSLEPGLWTQPHAAFEVLQAILPASPVKQNSPRLPDVWNALLSCSSLWGGIPRHNLSKKKRIVGWHLHSYCFPAV